MCVPIYLQANLMSASPAEPKKPTRQQLLAYIKRQKETIEKLQAESAENVAGSGAWEQECAGLSRLGVCIVTSASMFGGRLVPPR